MAAAAPSAPRGTAPRAGSWRLASAMSGAPWRGGGAGSSRVVEDGARGVSPAGVHAADAGAEVDAVRAAPAVDRAVVDGEHDAVALRERNDHRARLHPRALLGEHEFAAR